MIVRVTRASVRAGKEQHVVDTLRDAASQVGSAPPGLRALVIGRRASTNGTRSDQIVGISVWDDLDALTSAMGPDWARPNALPGLEDYVEDTQVEHFETLVGSVQELFEKT